LAIPPSAIPLPPLSSRLPRLHSISGQPLSAVGPPNAHSGLSWSDDRPHSPFHPIDLDIDNTADFDSISPKSHQLHNLDSFIIPSISKLSSHARELFIRSLPSPLQLALNTTFGKPNSCHKFENDILFRHILYPLFCSSFLSLSCYRRLLCSFPTEASHLLHLVDEYADVDFSALQTQLLPDWEAQLDLDHVRGRMFSACLLHYNGDTF
jgi:hypothetical protein